MARGNRRPSGGGNKSGGFDPNKDYSLAIKQAQQSGASQSTINQLRQERQNKIDSNYGGVDPYKGSSDIMGTRGSSGSSGSSSSSGSSRGSGSSGGYTPSYSPAPYQPAPYNPAPYNGPAGSPSSYTPKPAAPAKSAGEYLRDSGGDYSLAIQYAKNAGADTSTVAALQQGRQEKIDRQYGGVDPYQGNNHIMRPGTWRGGNYSQDSILGQRDQTNQDLLDGKTIYYDRGYGMGTGSLRLDKPWHEGVDYAAEAEKYAAQGDWDAVDDALMRRGHKMWDTGSNGGGRDNLQVWYDLNQKYNGPSAGTSLQDMYMGAGQAYGYGGKDGLDGINDPNYDSLPWQDMLSREEYMNTFYGPQGGYGPGAPGGPNGPGLPGGYGGGYGSFEDFLNGMGYGDMEAQTRAAIQAAVQQAMNGYNAQIDAVNKDTDELARQAYIAKMQGEKNLDQQLAANGYAGGMADSQRIASEAGYQDRLSQLDMQAEATIAELQRAIQNAQLTGDMQTAQELSGYLQQMQGQWNAYMQNQQQMAQQDYWNQQNMANQDYWNQQQMDQQNRENNYARAMTMLQAGILPDDYTLNAAGINKGVAQQMVQQALMAQTAQAAPKATPKAAPKGPAPKGPAPKGPAPMPPAPKTEEPAKTGNSPALFIVNNPTMTTAQKIDAIEKYVKKGPANGGITEEEGLAYLAALGY